MRRTRVTWRKAKSRPKHRTSFPVMFPSNEKTGPPSPENGPVRFSFLKTGPAFPKVSPASRSLNCGRNGRTNLLYCQVKTLTRRGFCSTVATASPRHSR